MLAQERGLRENLDSLQKHYSLYPNLYPQVYLHSANTDSISIPPPPPLNGKEKMITEEDDVNIRAYAIPTQLLTSYYPWDADSIVVSTANNGRLGLLSKQDKEFIVDLFYNYDRKIIESDTPLIIIRSEDCDCNVPIADFRMTFYHNTDNLRVDFFTGIDNGVRIKDSSVKDWSTEEILDDEYYTTLRWGCILKEEYLQIISLFEKRFNTTINLGNYENIQEEMLIIRNLELKHE